LQKLLKTKTNVLKQLKTRSKTCFRYTLTCNTLIRSNLLHKSGPIDRFTSVGVEGFYALIRRYWSSASFTFNDLDPVNDLRARGVEDEALLPEYYYRDDALRLWSHIHRCVQQIVDLFYNSDGDVVADSELQVFTTQRTCMFIILPVWPWRNTDSLTPSYSVCASVMSLSVRHIHKSLFTENTVASKEKKAQQRKHKYNKVHDSRWHLVLEKYIIYNQCCLYERIMIMMMIIIITSG